MFNDAAEAEESLAQTPAKLLRSTKKRKSPKRRKTRRSTRVTERTTKVTKVVTTKVTKVVTTKTKSTGKAGVTPKKPKVSKVKPKTKNGYRSKFERRVAKQLRQAGVKFTHEPHTISYVTRDGKAHTYLPDFIIGDRRKTSEPKWFLETKGYFVGGPKDREKLALVKEQNPGIDLRICFQDENLTIEPPRGWIGQMDYAEWADSVGIDWAGGGLVRPEWLKPPSVWLTNNESGTQVVQG